MNYNDSLRKYNTIKGKYLCIILDHCGFNNFLFLDYPDNTSL